MAKTLYWIGKGTILHNGKILDPKKSLPKSLEQNFIDRQIKLKNIGEKIQEIEPVLEEKKAKK